MLINLKHTGLLIFVVLQISLQAQTSTGNDTSSLDKTRLQTNNYYHIDFKNELKYIIPSIGLNAISLVMLTQIDEISLVQLDNLDPLTVNSFDRGATNKYSSSSKLISDILLYSGVSVPLLALTNIKCREENKAIAVMALETFLITSGITSMTKVTTKRYRPFTYNPLVPLDDKLTTGSRLSFFSGHASVISGLSFFTAKVITDLNPDMKNKVLMWSAAAAFPAAIGYFRFQAGKHFPTDVIAGYALGATIGILVPTLHLKEKVTLNYEGNGLSLQVRF